MQKAFGILAGIFTVVAGIINPFKYVDIIGAVVGALDLWLGLGTTTCIWAVTGSAWELGAAARHRIPHKGSRSAV